MSDPALRYRFGDCELDPARLELRRDGVRVDVQPRVFDCLHYLLANRARSVGKQELQDRVWTGQVVTEAALTRAIMKARRAIGDDAESPRFIRTEHARGYRFVGSVEVIAVAAEADAVAAEAASAPAEPELPVTRYARSGEVSIAYQVLGEGPLDLVLVPGWVSHLEYAWTQPRVAHLLRRLASFARVILFDKRGTGMSDRQWGFPTLEDRIDDLRAVMDAVGSARATVLGISEGGCMSVLFAATHPERVQALCLFGSYPRRTRTPDYPWAPPPEACARWLDAVRRDWGVDAEVALWAPSLADDSAFRRWWSSYLRMSASPGAAFELTRAIFEMDVREVLPAVRAPTLVLHRRGDLLVRIEEGRYLAERIPDARMVELPGDDHLIYAGDVDAVVDAVQAFVREVQDGPPTDTVLATVVALEACDGDAEALDAVLALQRGRALPGTTPRFAFDGPARALRFAGEALRRHGQPGARAGIHVSECEQRGEDLHGPATRLAPAIARRAALGQILVSSTIADLVVGAGFVFTEAGHLEPGEEGAGQRLLQAVDPRA